MTYFGGIETGGTKIVSVVTDEGKNILAEMVIPTTTPSENLAQLVAFFKAQNALLPQPISAVGVACFGPLDLDPSSPSYGAITSTPKPGWANTPIVRPLQEALGVPVAMDTDVNAAALGEGRWGAAVGLSDFIYLTIGTGIGGGAVVNGQILHGLVHTEMGHVRIPHDRAADPFPGSCVYHVDCFEGLAAGPALLARWKVPGGQLPTDHPAWQLEAHYIALALASFVCTLSPKRFILGGGVMAQSQLFPLIRAETQHLLNGYIQSPALQGGIDSYIVPPSLGSRAGVLGAVALAQSLKRG